MIQTIHINGGDTPFQGDRALEIRSIAATSKILRATAVVTPVDLTNGAAPFTETINFVGNAGDFGATKISTASFVEVDFHARRTLARVEGTNLNSNGTFTTTLQVDVGAGVYVDINAGGAFKGPPPDPPFLIKGDAADLPGLGVTKLKLTNTGSQGQPDVTRIKIRSVPLNVSLRLGTQSAFWTHLGEMNQLDSVPDFAAVLQAFLVTAKVENGFYVVPMTLHSDSLARLEVSLEIAQVLRQSALPGNLKEVVIPYDYSSLPKSDTQVAVTLPKNAQIVPEETSVRVRGAFDETRVVVGGTGAVKPDTAAEISPTSTQAQPVALSEKVAATGIDLLLKPADQPVRMRLDVRLDQAGKPDDAPLFTGPVDFTLNADPQHDAVWISVPLPAEFLFQPGGYWIVIQALDGSARWNVRKTGDPTQAMQRSQDGGLSWRATTVPGSSVTGSVAGFFRFRRKPETFQVPIQLQVGPDDQAARVKLDRFAPLGRVDFTPDIELAQAFNQFLEKTRQTGGGACPEGEHLANGDFHAWHLAGSDLAKRSVPNNGTFGVNFARLASAPDGRFVYAASSSESQAALDVIDVLCDAFERRIDLGSVSLGSFAIHPDGLRAFVSIPSNSVAGSLSSQIRVIDLKSGTQIGDPLTVDTSITDMVFQPDGSRLYLLGSRNSTDGDLIVVDIGLLERQFHGESVSGVTSPGPALPSGKHANALAIAPDGSRLFVAVTDNATTAGEIVDTQAGPGIIVGNHPVSLAITPDGTRAVTANAGGSSVSVVDLARGADVFSPIALDSLPNRVAIAADGKRAFVTRADSKLSVIDLNRGTVDTSLPPASAVPVDIVRTPQGDRIYYSTQGTMEFIAVGSRLPDEWSLTTGVVQPICLPGTLGVFALLGQVNRRKSGSLPPNAISQVVPVAACPYVFSFRGIATGPDAVAELLWSGPTCALLRTDSIPISTTDPTATRVVQVPAHRLQATPPAGAVQVEVRFRVPGGDVAALQAVLLAATSEALANGDLQIQQNGAPANWTVNPATPGAALLSSTSNGVQVRNSGAGVSELVQKVPVPATKTFALEFRGSNVSAQKTGPNPQVQIQWLKADGSSAGAPNTLDISASGSDHFAATGAAPDAATQAEIHVAVPPGGVLQIHEVSFRFVETTSVPLTFIAQAPGELTISDLKVGFEIAPAPLPPVPAGGLCTPVPPVSDAGDDCCYCCCCGKHTPMKKGVPATTPAGRPAIQGVCATCGTTVSQLGGALDLNAPMLAFPRLPAIQREPVKRLLPVTATFVQVFGRGVAVAQESLTVIKGIGNAREQQLREIGIHTVDELATASPEVVSEKLTGVSREIALDMIEQARRLIAGV
jgi:DNA-binding beta-propeller fold protein YncE